MSWLYVCKRVLWECIHAFQQRSFCSCFPFHGKTLFVFVFHISFIGLINTFKIEFRLDFVVRCWFVIRQEDVHIGATPGNPTQMGLSLSAKIRFWFINSFRPILGTWIVRYFFNLFSKQQLNSNLGFASDHSLSGLSTRNKSNLLFTTVFLVKANFTTFRKRGLKIGHVKLFLETGSSV